MPNHYYEFLKNGESFIARINEIIDKQDESLNIPFESLKTVNDLVKQYLEIVSKDDIPPKDKRHRVITRIVVDSWPLNTELGNNLSEWESLYIMLEN